MNKPCADSDIRILDYVKKKRIRRSKNNFHLSQNFISINLQWILGLQIADFILDLGLFENEQFLMIFSFEK